MVVIFIVVGVAIFFLLGSILVSLFVYIDDKFDIDLGCVTAISSDIAEGCMPFILWPFSIIFFFLKVPILFIVAQIRVCCYLLSLDKRPITVSKLFSLTLIS